jgi:glutamate carboxypeptidase
VPVSTEEIIVNHVEEEHGRAVALLEKAVNINSGSMNFAGIKAVAELLAPEFEELGFITEWIDGEPFGRAGHLVASRERRGPKILLRSRTWHNGHERRRRGHDSCAARDACRECTR